MLPDGGAEEEQWLTEGIAGVQQNTFYMHRPRKPMGNPKSTPNRSFFGPCHLTFLPRLAIWVQDSNHLKDALFSTQMLSELRTSRLSPHKYYELCEYFGHRTLRFVKFWEWVSAGI